MNKWNHIIRKIPHYKIPLFFAPVYLFLTIAFCAVLFVNLYPVGSFFEKALTPSTQIFDRNGVLLYETLNTQAGRTQIATLDSISPYLVKATIITEDESFYTNSGIDVLATVRAVFENAQSGKVVSGASTITQQLVRNVLGIERKRTVANKIKEAFFALRINKKYEKDEILELYLNKVYYGNLNYGVAAAAHSYFGVQPRDLDLAQSALLAGIPQSPSRFDPFKYPEKALERKNVVLERMFREGEISDEEYTAAREEKLIFEPRSVAIRAPHFVHYIIDELTARFGPDFATQGLKVATSIDVNLNDRITEMAQRQIDLIRPKNVTNASVVVLDPETSHIRAMVGSLDYFDDSIEGRVNMALASRQPGSAMKPITYAVAFEKGWTGATTIKDEPSRFFTADGQPYYPQNYDFEFHGDVSVRESLANSYNIPAVKAIQFAGVQAVLDKAHAMGITTLRESADHYGLALTLGDGEVTLLDLANVYQTLANAGVRSDPVAILTIKNQKGETIWSAPQRGAEPSPRTADVRHANQPLTDDIAFMLSDILSDNHVRIAEFGLENVLALDRPAAVKTGTTRNFKDNWTLGYTPDFVVGVWVGNTNNDPMRNVSGIQGAGPIWHDVMTELHRTLPVRDFTPPASVEKRDDGEWYSRRINYSALAQNTENSNSQTGEFRIIKPFDGDVFQYQNHINEETQQVKLTAGPLEPGESVQWFVDGTPLPPQAYDQNQTGSAFWSISVGEHSIKAVNQLKESQIRVRVEQK